MFYNFPSLIFAIIAWELGKFLGRLVGRLVDRRLNIKRKETNDE